MKSLVLQEQKLLALMCCVVSIFGNYKCLLRIFLKVLIILALGGLMAKKKILFYVFRVVNAPFVQGNPWALKL